MGKDSATTRTLRRALATLGSEERLAAALNCSLPDLMHWLFGRAARAQRDVHRRARYRGEHGRGAEVAAPAPRLSPTG
jgi:hypothetical protein